ncbi:hypothetical protein KFL_000050640 [Klebsormidium nitens]|uniref:Uncharacterized protein n=1 Tax=Klebsormidium nitens TaxID=105231 RepID=A0A1Y1HQ16_KLENI|nr:hypothetical protein KFL_000050640 [Klebsormidium nitens]|eukprot:GAQ77928.1 hypothetical protein KFL_000050640 [Klebsormidium nitens]
MAFGSLQSHCHTATALLKRNLVTMECPRGAGSRTGSLLGENAHELLSRSQELSCNGGAMHQAAKGLADVGAAGAKGGSGPQSGSLAGESIQMVLEWTLPRDAYNVLRSFRFRNDDIKMVFAAQTAVGGAFD